MQSNLVSFIQVLRSHDVRVSPAESLDAVDVAATLGYADRSLLRDGLAMTLAKTPEEEVVFHECFDRFFRHELADFSMDDSANSEDSEAAEGEDPAGGESGDTAGEDAGNDGAEQESALEFAAESNATLQALMQSQLMQDLVNNDRNALTLAMNQAAEAVGLSDIELFTQRGQYTRRILDEMGEDQIRNAVIELEQEGSPALPLLQQYRDVLREQVRDYVEREYLLHAEGRNQQFMEDILAKTRL
ncbi:MAG: hypothetical protein HKN19_15960, partial [Halioglobus sp.]|nr:hypothetical protein [Halioglobus sp.]